jgi:hypothetical protein
VLRSPPINIQAITRFTQLADESEDVPTLRKKKYSDFRLSKLEWDRLKLLHEVMQVCDRIDRDSTLLTLSPKEPATAQQSFSRSHEPAVWRTIPVLEFLQQSWENMAGTAKFSELQDAIEAGLENLRKWYRRTDDTDVYFICLGKCSVKWQGAILTLCTST